MKFARNDKRKVTASVELTPLIDVVFQLLIFFMVSSTFVVQTSIPIEVPEAEGSERLEQKDTSITLSTEAGGPDGNGKVFIDDVEIVDWAELSSAMAALRERRPEALVLIRADRDIPTGRTIKVLGIVTNQGIQHYGVLAESPQEGV